MAEILIYIMKTRRIIAMKKAFKVWRLDSLYTSILWTLGKLIDVLALFLAITLSVEPVIFYC